MKEKLPMPRGRVRPVMVNEHYRVIPLGRWSKNLVLFDAATIVAKLLQGNSDYRIAAMYLEFQNMADPDDPAEIPAFDRSGGIDYFSSLSGSPSRDYLRVPLTTSQLTSTDESTYPGGNLLTFFAMSAGTIGVHGKTFSDSENSKLCGGALVATPSVGDASQDLIMSREYLAVADQQVKLPTSQLGLLWELELG